MAGTNFKVKNGLEIQSGTVIAGGGAGTNGQVLASTGTGVQWVNAATGTGDVVGPASATDNAVVRFDGTTGKLIQNSTVTLSDTGVLTVPELSTTSITSTGNNPIIIAPDGTGDVHLNADSVRIGDNNTDATLITRGTGDLLLTTNEGSATEGIIRIYDGANGNITLTPNGTGQVQVGSDQVVTLIASQTLTNKTLSSNSVWNGNVIGSAYGGAGTVNGILKANGSGTVSAASAGTDYVTSVSVTSPVSNTGTTANPTIALASGYGDTQNPYGSKTANYFLAAPNGSAGVPTWRSIVAADIPTLNQNTTGTAANVTGTVAVANGGTGLTTLTAGYIPYGNGTSAFGSSANLFWDSANSRLGIGTASPSTKLHVSNAGVNAQATFVGTTGAPYITVIGNSGTTILGNESNGGWVGTVGSQSFVFKTTDIERVRIDSSGNIGIGTSSINSKVQIVADSAIAENGSIVTIATGGGNLVNKLNLGVSSANNYAFIQSVKPGTDVYPLLLNPSGGNVGIGTSSPTQKIMLGGQTGATSTPLALQFSADWSNGYVAEKCKIYLYNGGGTGLWGFAIGPDNDIQYHSGGAGNTNGQHKWYTGNTETMRLNASGNLGIGVTPLSKLDVNGVITLRDSALTGSGRAEITSTAFVGITMASGNYVFNNATNTTEYARLTSTGLGIGTSSPATKLNISGTLRFTPNTADTNYSADIKGNYDSAHPFQIDVKNNGSSAEYIGVYADGGGSNNRVVFPTGNVGIGTSSPSEKLNVSGKIKASDVLLGNNGTKGYGAITTTSSTSTPTGGSSGDHYYIY